MLDNLLCKLGAEINRLDRAVRDSTMSMHTGAALDSRLDAIEERLHALDKKNPKKWTKWEAQ